MRFALLSLGKDFDLVISGINKGYNMGEDILYSGTDGAAFEAALRGVKAVALSTGIETFRYAFENLDAVKEYFPSTTCLPIPTSSTSTSPKCHLKASA